jgi:hypothetical protein
MKRAVDNVLTGSNKFYGGGGRWHYSLRLGKTQNWAGSEARRGFDVAGMVHDACAKPF